jgi:hypothetical protein
MKSPTVKSLTVLVALLAAMTFAKARSTTNAVERGQPMQYSERAPHS